MVLLWRLEINRDMLWHRRGIQFRGDSEAAPFSCTISQG